MISDSHTRYGVRGCCQGRSWRPETSNHASRRPANESGSIMGPRCRASASCMLTSSSLMSTPSRIAPAMSSVGVVRRPLNGGNGDDGRVHRSTPSLAGSAKRAIEPRGVALQLQARDRREIERPPRNRARPASGDVDCPIGGGNAGHASGHVARMPAKCSIALSVYAKAARPSRFGTRPLPRNAMPAGDSETAPPSIRSGPLSANAKGRSTSFCV